MKNEQSITSFEFMGAKLSKWSLLLMAILATQGMSMASANEGMY